MISIFVRTLIIYILLSVALKVMGKRQIGELDVSELVSTLLISEIAAIPIDDPDLPLMNAIVPILFILSMEILLSYAKNKSNILKRYVEGESVFLIYKQEILQHSLKENRISVNELLSEMRSQGYGSLASIEYAMLEQSGKISFIEKGEDRLAHTVVIDGEFNDTELELLPYSKSDVLAELERRGVNIRDVFLMTVDDMENVKITVKEDI